MPKSRGRKSVINQKDETYRRRTRADDVYSKLSYHDKQEARSKSDGLVGPRGETTEAYHKRRDTFTQAVEDVAGKPGSFTTRPGGDIKRKKKKAK